jgi:cytochrome c553
VPYILVFLAGILVGSCRGASPSSELLAAVNDLRANVPQERWRSQLFLSTYNFAESERDSARAIVAYVANTVSRSSTIQPASYSGNLVRLDVDSLGIPREAIEALGSEDPYWKIRTRIADPTTGRVSIVYTDSPAIDLKAAAELRAMTGRTSAIMRADWFVTKASQPPHYYSLAGIAPDIEGWYKAVGADPKTIVALQANRGANLFRREPTQKPGRISRWQGALGGVWNTYDSREDDPLKDPFRNPTFTGKFDAMEVIAARANGTLSYGLYDGKTGKRQDEAPADIARDTSDPTSDGRLVPMLSCVRCHTSDGYRGFSDDQTALANSGIDLHLSEKDTAQLASFYGKQEQLAKEMKRDMEDYASAAKLATGGALTANQIPAALGKIVREYEYEKVNNAKAMRELGVDTLAPLFGSTDVYALAVAKGFEVSRKQFDASFSEMAALCSGVKR